MDGLGRYACILEAPLASLCTSSQWKFSTKIEYKNHDLKQEFLHDIIRELQYFDDLQLLVQKFTQHKLNAPHKWRIPRLKKNYAHVIHGLLERNQPTM